MNSSMTLCVLCVSVVISSIGCEEKVRPSVVAIPQSDVASQESWNSTVTFTDSGKVKAILWSGHISVFTLQQYTQLDDSMHVDFFDEREKHTSSLTARRGRVDDRTRDFEAHENVIVVSDSGTTLQTEKLFWNNDTRKIFTDAYVEITSPTEIIRGYGMESDQSLKNYKIFRVTGQAIPKD